VAVPPLRVLVCEDADDTRDLLVTLLEQQGLQVDETSSGRAALAMLLEGRHHIAFLDIGLPDISGLSVAAQFRAAKLSLRTRLVAISGYATVADIAAARAAGFDLHLRKPATLDQLLAAVRSAR
jgi:two-component system CheB/CheR fusion protein